MRFRICVLGGMALVTLFCTGCSVQEEKTDPADLERMALELAQPVQHQEIAEETPLQTPTEQVR